MSFGMLDGLATLVRAVGQALMAWRAAGQTAGTWMGPQLKAEADAAAHARMTEGLARLDPHLPIVSEEDSGSHTEHRPARYFLIDPLDGTASWAGGFPGWVTQVALMDRAGPVLAAIFAPAFDQLFLAQRANGATLNGKALRLTKASERQILIDNYPEPRATARQVFDALGCDAYVESGSIGLKICRIADDTADIFFKDVVVRDWDIAPGHLVLEEAGGVLVAPDGKPITYAGSYEKSGVIAARRRDQVEMVARQLNHHDRGTTAA